MIVHRLNVGPNPIGFRADFVAMVAEKKEKRPIGSGLNHISEQRAVDVETGLATRIVMAKLGHGSASERVAVRTDVIQIEVSGKPSRRIGLVQLLEPIKRE